MSRKDKCKFRNWTNEKTVLSLEILVYHEFNLANRLEWRALKRPANEEVSQEILKIFKP